VTVNCTTVCSGQIAAPIGSDTFAMILYDARNAAGHVLSTGTLTQTIVQNQANSVNVTLDGVVAALQVGLDPATVNAGTPATVAVTVNALDADGNVIVGPGVYVSVSGSPLTVYLSDSDTSGATTLSKTSFGAPTTGITLSYNGAAIANPTVTASATAATSGQATLKIAGGAPTITLCKPQSFGAPFYITAGSDGAMWFTQTLNGEIGRITSACALTEYSAGTPAGDPAEITSGSDGALWFTEPTANQIGRMTTAGVVTLYPLTTANASPNGITSGPDGALWFTELTVGRIGRITTAGVMTEYVIPTANARPAGITTGPDGALWFTEGSTTAADAIGRITTAGTITQFGLQSGAGPGEIVTGSDGALWFTETNNYYGARIGRMTTAGVVTQYPLPTADFGATLTDIVAGPDGALWFTPYGTVSIGRITTAGAITFDATGPNGSTEYLYGLAFGPGGTLWFTVPNAPGEIGQLQP
jgi:virginiamycin B lyase